MPSYDSLRAENPTGRLRLAMRRQDLLDLNDALQHPGRKVAVDISTELPDETEVDLAEPVEGYLEAVSTGNLLLLTGNFKARVHVDCARCGAPLETDVSFDVDEQFSVEGVPSSLSSQDYAKVVADEPYPMFEGNSLQVEELLRQDLLLAVPNQVLCSHGWDGDCPIARAQTARKQAESSTPFAGLSRLSAFRKNEDTG